SGVRIRDAPLADLHRVEPGPIVDVVAIVEADDLFHGSHLDASQAADSEREVTVGARKILRPQRGALRPVGIIAAGITVVPARRVHQARKSPFALFLIIGREWYGPKAIFDAGVFPEGVRKRAIERERGAEKDERAAQKPQSTPEIHGRASPPRYHRRGFAQLARMAVIGS